MNCIAIQLQTPCTACGTVMAVNGLIGEVVCPKCATRRSIEPVMWKNILQKSVSDGLNLPEGRPESFTWKTGSLSSIVSYHLVYAKSPPNYPDGTPVDVDEVVACAPRGYFDHPATGTRISIRAFPEGFREAAPRRKKIKHAPTPPYELFVMGEDSSCIEGPGPDSIPLAEPGPVRALKCTECGSPLEAAGDARNIRCGHCGTWFFIPAPLWHAMHPPGEVTTWHLLVR